VAVYRTVTLFHESDTTTHGKRYDDEQKKEKEKEKGL
jgi:hypothetical protein